VVAVAVARVYVGAHSPVDVIGGFALGWVVGSIIHLALGAPRGAPDPSALAARLQAQGIAVRTLEPLARGTGTFRAETLAGDSLYVRVVDRDRREADWLYRAWRLIAFRDAGEDRDPRNADHAVEHEALALALASRSCIPVPELLWTARLTEGESILVRRWLAGCDLAEVAPRDTSALEAAWHTLNRLHDAGIAHGSADMHGFVVTDGGVACIDLAHARLHATPADRRHDIAELLASSAAVVGPAEALRCAVSVLGPARLVDALPVIQPLALSGSTRASFRGSRGSRGSLDELRARIAELGGVPTPPAERPMWVASRNLAPLALGTFALVLLLSQAGSFRLALDAAGHADPVWLAAAVLSAAITYVMAAIALMGAAPQPLALGRTATVQLAAAFTNRLAPAGLGALATNVRYLERAGVRRSRAATTVGVDAAAGVVVHVILLVALVPLVGLRTSLKLPSAPDLDAYWPVAVFIVVGLTIAGVWYWRHRLRAIVDRIRPHARDARSVLEHPRRSLLLFGGSLGVTLAQAFVLVACLEAVGVRLAAVTVIAVFVVGSALAAAAPTPGGLGALEAALVAGLGQVGVPTASAVAAVLMSRVIGYWLPVLPGWLAFAAATRNGTL
jgi:glycosyltransferase 2 family protein